MPLRCQLWTDESESWWVTERLAELDESQRLEISLRLIDVYRLGLTLNPKLLEDVIEGAAKTDSVQAWRQPLPPLQQRTLVNPNSLVYYLRFADRVKIGTTTRLSERLKSIPHDEVLALEPGDLVVEKHRHREFAALRIHHEWFRYEQPLIGHIESLRTAAA